ncbi:MAG: bifunctional glutamate N-acetyltransferase/amino-acid acetyltransferase ArgJ [Syntrophaceae bacterium]|jgi:glutamate N-acetyltransferase/amino-acid N-acetyltransferase|nr:bifunctional glutamate N-acetyltransferase/amino-acid acetyltransferase ArgJ [Syntrophaceae bacterium]
MNEHIPPDFQVPGFLAAGIAAGIKKTQVKDFALLFSEDPATAAGVFTANRVKAAPVLLSRERLKSGKARAILANSGCANACTGKKGIADGQTLSRRVASSLKIAPGEVLLASTGVIGKPLPLEIMEGCLPALVSSLSPQGLADAAQAIMTTDTKPKAVISRDRVNGEEVTVAGIAKGAGMISPRMATLLVFVLTDADISAGALRKALNEGVQGSFNRITVDGDMSTNDTLLVLANGRAKNRRILPGTPGFKKFSALLSGVLLSLARKTVADGEGVTKVVRIVVEGARTGTDAEKVVRAVANSPLVKTAFFGEDANWGRILCAVGYSGAPVDPDKVDIFFDQVQVARKGQAVGTETEEPATAVMKKGEYTVRIRLNQGKKMAYLFTTDFSFDYVKINASYRS